MELPKSNISDVPDYSKTSENYNKLSKSEIIEFKGTKGKWYLAESDIPQLRVVSEYEVEDICECLLEADAKLISCAPEMLEMLNRIENYSLLDGSTITYDLQELIKKATTI